MNVDSPIGARRLIASPIGLLLAEADERALVSLRLTGGSGEMDGPKHASASAEKILDRVEAELDAYFSGSLQRFSVPIVLPKKESDFSKRVWRKTMEIPYGSVCSYARLARMVGTPKGARAVGSALRRNPILVVVPCHRVISATGDAGEYLAGRDIKQWLLRLESDSLGCLSRASSRTSK